MITDYYSPMSREILRNKKTREPGPLVAYDFETTRIPTNPLDPMTVQPRYLTVYGNDKLICSESTRTYADVYELFCGLWPSFENRTRLSAWNGNRFDVRLLFAALLRPGSNFIIEPFIAKQAGLRGAKIRRRGERSKSVTVTDGCAMLGLQCKLREVLNVFAPNLPKHDLDFDVECFDSSNPNHVSYAERDSEGLYYALQSAETIIKNLTGFPLQITIGQLGIKTFTSNLPKGVEINVLSPSVFRTIRDIGCRGGFCYARKYKGKAWTYDINQAYASAMRDSALPCGRMVELNKELRKNDNRPAIYFCSIISGPGGDIPYTFRDSNFHARNTSQGGFDTVLCNIEVSLLRRHGWCIEVHGGWCWEESFNMDELVTKLETVRKQHEHGTPLNTISKSLGNNAYGKTLETERTSNFRFCEQQPKRGLPLCDISGEILEYLWEIPTEGETRRYYSRPQLGAFITAFVRCKLYERIMENVDIFVKADTDSITFSAPVSTIPISKWKYGDWKIEAAGTEHIVITKKVYYKGGTNPSIVCKGLRTDKLDVGDFECWYYMDTPPKQVQVQLQNIKKGLAPTYKIQERKGTKVK